HLTLLSAPMNMSLSIVLTMMASLLLALARAGQPAGGDEAKSLKTIEALGGQVGRGTKAGTEYVASVDLSGSAANDKTLEDLKELKNMEVLNLEGTGVTDQGLTSLEVLKNLRELDLSRTNVTDDGMKVVGSLKRLRSVKLGFGKVTDVGIKNLEGL